ncbi:MAG: WG repeat-containing protein [Butyricicoccus sp.]|nr:WG repeat-containing protein [Butyricicoccus sp.]
MKKYLLSILFAAAMLTASAAAADLFPVENIAADGYTSWGYMDESGTQAIPYQYTSASAFNEEGFATVTDNTGCLAVIDETGNSVIPMRAAPEEVEFGENAIAFRYDGYTIYFDKQGQELAEVPGAAGFLSDDGLLAVQAEDGAWGYMSKNGTQVIAPAYRQAGEFSDGYAVVQLMDSPGYAVIDTKGNEIRLPTGATPLYMEVYGGKIVILTNGNRQALYTLPTEPETEAVEPETAAEEPAEAPTGAFLTDYIYQELSAFHDGYAMARQNNRWGIICLDGSTAVPFQYNYMSYMGEGVYAVRSGDGSVAAIDASGAIIYRTYGYVGGFDTITHGVAWHGTMDNGIIFFSKVGGYITKLTNAENPTILTDDIALVTIGGKRQYVRLHDKKTLYSPDRSYDLGYCKITTTSYEKYLGTDQNGTEYGWQVTYPVVSGMNDRSVQNKVNAAIENFFLSGPSASAQRLSLTGSYGVRLVGRLLVVWAGCISGTGDGTTVWNDNVVIDLATGQTYSAVTDLFTKDYADTVIDLLPEDIPFYLFSYPRITDRGVSFFYNVPQDSASGQRAPTSKEYALTFDQLRAVLRTDSECYKALNGNAMGTLDQYTGYADVQEGHWAYAAIQTVTEADLMHGDDGKFEPDAAITGAEVAAVMVRLLDIDTSAIAPPDGAPWYYVETTAAQNSGLMEGLGSPIEYAAPMTREDAMQVLANMLQSQGDTALTDEEVEAELAPFTDADAILDGRRAAAALCVKSGLVVGSEGKLEPKQTFTRAQFAQILSLLL